MEFENLLYDVTDGIATITINRPKALNALNSDTLAELDDALLEADGDEEAGIVIITGAGDKAFVAGADITELAEQNVISGKEFAEFGQAIFNNIFEMTKPVIAAINGFALGGGCELAMACHIRYAHASARFGQPEVNLGIIPGYGGTQRLPRLIGMGPALEILLTGEMVNADKACRLGLVNDVYATWISDENGEPVLNEKGKKQVDLEGFMATVRKRANLILSKGPLAVRFTMEAAKRGAGLTLEDGQTVEADLFGITCGSEDFKEGTSAFLEKRNPDFNGK